MQRLKVFLQSWARDNTVAMNMFSSHKVVFYCNITIFVVDTPSRHRDLNIFKKILVPEALLRCRVVDAAKL